MEALAYFLLYYPVWNRPESQLSAQALPVSLSGSRRPVIAVGPTRVTLSYRHSEFFRINEQTLSTVNQCCSFENPETEPGIDIEGIVSGGAGVAIRHNDGRVIAFYAVFYFVVGGSTPRTFLEKIWVDYG